MVRHNIRKSIMTSLLFCSITAASLAEEGLVAFYDCDEGSGNILSDKSGNGFNAELQGNFSWVEGKKGRAVYFDGKTTWAKVPVSDKLRNAVKDAVTIEAWIKGAGVVLAGSKHGSYCNGSYQLSISRNGTNGKVGFTMYVDKLYHPQGFYMCGCNTLIDLDSWHHVAAVYDGNDMKIFIDGKAVKTQTYQYLKEGKQDAKVTHEHAGKHIIDRASGLNLGVHYSPSAGKDHFYGFFMGIMDEIRLYNRALSAEEIYTHFKDSREENKKESVVLNGKNGVVKFDFGASFLRFPGFIPCSPKDLYTKEKGFGWTSNNGLSSYVENFKTDNLCQDFVYLYGNGTEAEFNVDLPNGDYTGVVWMGDLENYTKISPQCHTLPVRSWEISSEGTTLLGKKVSLESFLKEYYQNVNNDYQGGDVWQKYIAPIYGPYIFSVKVRNNQLKLKFRLSLPQPSKKLAPLLAGRTDILPINALALYPESEKSFRTADLIEIKKKRRSNFYENFPLPAAPSGKQVPAYNSPNKDFILFTPHYMKRIYPDTVPTAEEIGKTFKTFATPGEYEPVALGVYPLKNLSDVKVTVDDLRSDKGLIKSGNIQVRMVHYIAKPSRCGDAGLHESPIKIEPSYLYKVPTPLNITKGFTRSFQLTIKVPENAEPGIYNGKVSFSCDRGQVALPLKLRVLPVRLKVPDIPIVAETYGGWLYTRCPYLAFPNCDDKYWKLVEDIDKDMKEHGLTSTEVSIRDTVQKWNIPEKKIVYNPELLKKHFQAYKAAGLPSKYIIIESLIPFHFNVLRKASYEIVGDAQWEQEVIAFFRKIKATAGEYGLEPVFYPLGETSECGKEGVARTARFFRMLMNKAPDIKMISNTTSSKWEIEMVSPYVDFIGLHSALDQESADHSWYGDKISSKAIDTIRAKKNYLLYNAGHVRFSWGLYPWATNAVGRVQEFYCSSKRDPYNFWDGVDDYISCVIPGPEGMIPFLCYEEIREGIDDYRYVVTLENMVTMAKKQGKNTAQAEALLREIKENISPDLQYYWKAGVPKPEFYDKIRWKVASSILELQEKLK
ncbi:MAG: hypothetical protein PHV82_04810 [Victivallaceae bacterium]|nr:hypothetical protein [Victivallaceae bacterium]